MPNRLQLSAMLARLCPPALLPLLLLPLACGGSGGDGSVSPGARTGSVAVLVTDAPSDEFLQILLEITKVELLGDQGRATLFEDPDGRVFDLLALRDEIRVIGLARRVPAGHWEKIRLRVRRAELIRATPETEVEGTIVECPEGVQLDDPDLVCESIVPKVPGGGKLDLNPRGTIRVRAGELVLVRLDVDANKSVHLVRRGATLRYNLRPVVFVDVFTEQVPGRLVLLEGTIEDVDPAGGTFQLCNGLAVSDASEGERRRSEGLPDDDRCIAVQLRADTTLFGPRGEPIRMEDLAAETIVAVLGRFLLDFGEELRFEAEVVQVGGRDAVDRVAGVVVEPVIPNDGDFTIAPDPEGPVEAPILPIHLLEGSKLFTRSGEPFPLAQLELGDRVRAFGWLVEPDGDSPSFDAGVVFVETRDEQVEETVVRGEVTAPFDPGTGELTIQADLPDGGVAPLCIAIEPDDDVFRLTELEDMLRSVRIAPGDLTEGDLVDVFGVDAERCFDAETVIAQEGSG